VPARGVEASGSGRTRDEAQVAATQAISEAVRAQQAKIPPELEKRQEAYDAATEGGKKQSNIGGEDAVLVCP
jgi:hypothetical protein